MSAGRYADTLDEVMYRVFLKDYTGEPMHTKFAAAEPSQNKLFAGTETPWAEMTPGMMSEWRAACEAKRRGEEMKAKQELELEPVKSVREPYTGTRPSFILDSAKAIVYGPRQEQYGHPAVNFQRIADMWGGIFGRPVTRGEVGLAMIQLKVARAVNQMRAGASYEELRDSYVDIAGYAEATMRAMYEEAPE